MPTREMTMIQECFTDLCSARKRLKTVRDCIKDSFKESTAYVTAENELKSAQERMKDVRESIKTTMLKDFTDLEDAVDEVKSLEVAVESSALRLVMNGDEVTVKDPDGKEYSLKAAVRTEKAD